MKWIEITVISCTLTLSVPLAWAQDEEPAPDTAWFEAARQNRLERNREVTERRTAKRMKLVEGTRRFECRIESLLDGTVMISKPYDEGLEPVLMKFGHRKVEAAPDHADRVLYEGRSYQIFSLREDVPIWKVQKYVGQEVELELERFAYSGAVRIVRIRELTRERRR